MVATIAFSARATGQTPPLVDIAGSGDPAYSYATVNNDAGQIAGVRDGRPFLWDSTQGMMDLGWLPGTTFGEPRGINQSGQMFGVTDAPRMWVWTNGSLHEPSSLGYGENAVALNNAGRLVGSVQTASGGRQAAVWDINTPDLHVNPLGTFGGDNSEAIAVNQSGQVIGYARSRHSCDTHSSGATFSAWSTSARSVVPTARPADRMNLDRSSGGHRPGAVVTTRFCGIASTGYRTSAR
jgi:uncharacterized membrane protein